MLLACMYVYHVQTVSADQKKEVWSSGIQVVSLDGVADQIWVLWKSSKCS